MSVVVQIGSGVGRYFGALGALLLMSMLAFYPGAVVAAETDLTAHQIVASATKSVMVVVEQAHEYADEDPERYYNAVDEILGPVIDYRGFARSVMGPYGSGDRYRSLNEAGREKLRGQLERFTQVMRTGLVTTYSKGLLAFSGSRIEVSDPSDKSVGQTKVSVQQLIYNEGTQPYILIYQMGLNREKQWKLRNIIIEDVNLGEIYRNQFQAAARKHDGDLDIVIENWSTAKEDN